MYISEKKVTQKLSQEMALDPTQRKHTFDPQ